MQVFKFESAFWNYYNLGSVGHKYINKITSIYLIILNFIAGFIEISLQMQFISLYFLNKFNTDYDC